MNKIINGLKIKFFLTQLVKPCRLVGLSAVAVVEFDPLLLFQPFLFLSVFL
jgi:hypothetical protein